MYLGSVMTYSKFVVGETYSEVCRAPKILMMTRIVICLKQNTCCRYFLRTSGYCHSLESCFILPCCLLWPFRFNQTAIHSVVILQSLTNVEHSGTWSLNWLTAACANWSNWFFWTNFWNYLSLEVIPWNRKHQSELLNKLVFPDWFNIGISYHKRENITVALAFPRLLLQKKPNQPKKH